MSAVGIATTLTMVIRITMVSVTSGAFTLVAQAVGARNPDHASSTAKQALTLVALIGVGFGLVGMAISAPALHFFSPTDSVARLGVPYLLVFFAGLVFLGLNYAIHNCLYGAGDTRTPLYLSLLTSAVKLLFSYALIFGAWGLPALGIVGAVTGTIIGQITGLDRRVVGYIQWPFRIDLPTRNLVPPQSRLGPPHSQDRHPRWPPRYFPQRLQLGVSKTSRPNPKPRCRGSRFYRRPPARTHSAARLAELRHGGPNPSRPAHRRWRSATGRPLWLDLNVSRAVFHAAIGSAHRYIRRPLYRIVHPRDRGVAHRRCLSYGPSA